MSVEVRQMVVKSNVVHSDKTDQGSASSRENLEEMKIEIINECKRMMTELLRDKKER